MVKSSVKGNVIRIIALALCVVWIGFCISCYVDDMQYLPVATNINEIDVREGSFIGVVYIEELYILERYVSVTSYQYGDSDNYEEPTYYLNTSTDYPTKSSITDFERFTVMFYDSTGTPYVTTLEKTGENDISVLLGKSGGKQVKTSLYVEVNGEYDQSLVGFEKHYSEVDELEEKSLTKCAKENNAQIADFTLGGEDCYVDRLIYLGETQKDVDRIYGFDSGMTYGSAMSPAAIVIIVIVRGFVKRKKQSNPENIAQKSE